jgi:Fibronectin type III-like domain
VVEPGAWGRLVNGGGWLTMEDQRVDLLYRDLDVVRRWLEEAEAGRYEVDQATRRLRPVGAVLPSPEGIFVAYRWYDARDIAPMFAFGHGLSYTEFRYSKLRVRRSGGRGGDGSDVGFRVRNIGSRTGAEVPQVYVGPPASPSAPMAEKSLAGFDRIELAPCQARKVTLPVGDVGARELSSGPPPRTTGSWRPAAGRSTSAPPRATPAADQRRRRPGRWPAERGRGGPGLAP